MYIWLCTVHMCVYCTYCCVLYICVSTVHLQYEHTSSSWNAYQYFVLFCNFSQKPELSGMFDVIDDLDFYLYPLENDLMTLAMDSAFSVSPSHYTV